MSAYICDFRHITAVAAAIVECDLATKETYLSSGHGLQRKLGAARLVANELFSENAASVAVAYSEPRATGFVFDEGTALEILSRADEHQHSKLPVIRLLKALACYRYQSTSHKGWEASRANKLTSEARERLIRHLPGYEEAAWGW